MVPISKKTLTTIDKLVQKEKFDSSKAVKAAGINNCNINDFDFSHISSLEVRKAIACIIVLNSDNPKINRRMQRLSWLVKNLDNASLSDCRMFFEAVNEKQNSIASKNSSADYNIWKRGILLADCLIRSGNPEEVYIAHCEYFGIIDYIGLSLLIEPFSEIQWLKDIWYIDISWLQPDIQNVIASFFFYLQSSKVVGFQPMYQFGHDLLTLKSKIPEYCTMEILLTTLETEFPKSLTVRYLKNHWHFLQIQKDEEFLYTLDRWEMNWFEHSTSRHARIDGPKYLDFSAFTDQETKLFVKKYIFYRLHTKDVSSHYIYETLRAISNTYTEFNGQLLKATQQDVIDFCSSKHLSRVSSEKNKKNATGYISKLATILSSFYKYLCVHDFIHENPWEYIKTVYKADNRRIRRRAISPYVLMQIFRILPEYPDEKYILMFLIMFDTGLRAVDVSTLRKTDLVVKGTTAPDGSFQLKGGELQYHNHKFNHESTVVLSKTLAIMLDEYRSHMVNGSDNPFLFPALNSRKKHVARQSFQLALQEWFIEHGVVNEDGSVFRFEAHGLRHTAAVRMKAAGIPIEAISAQLDHSSIEMTYRYLDTLDDDLYKKNKEYVDAHGEIADDTYMPNIDVFDKDAVRAAFDRIHAKMLPNGICQRPDILQTCPHYCTCINGECTYFRTNSSYLPIHEEQLKEEKKLLEMSISEPEKKTHQKNIQMLTALIRRLKGTDQYDEQTEIIQTTATIHS